jgi:hypothetical protein
MASFLVFCLDWASAFAGAPTLSEAQAFQIYHQIIARHAALEDYWLTLSGTLNTTETSSTDPKPVRTKIFLKVQNNCYHKAALTEAETLAHWVPHVDLWLRNDHYFADLYRAKANLSDPNEVTRWRFRKVNQLPDADDFQNFYLCRIHRETVLTAGYHHWRWSYLLSGSAKHLDSIKKVDCKTGSYYCLKFASSTRGLPIQNDQILDWAKVLVGSAQDGYVIYDTRIGAITAMNLYLVSDEGYHHLLKEAVNYRPQDKLVCPVRRECIRQLISAEGRAPRVPQINQFICDYELAVARYPEEIFTLSDLGLDEPEGLQAFTRSMSTFAIPTDTGNIAPPPPPPAPPSRSWLVLFSTGFFGLALTCTTGYYLFRRRKTRAKNMRQYTWAAD